ncbi:Uncharacterised protein [Bordetella pertussis]|nr:Uncharacterised protein [Bordetella pertussis]CFV95436.1 Uncharacterised protein [Bordetella pertussis]CPK41370.1 Uncharacterised protein [Bordetella pertussis]CPO28118.1 Uncharacterised protein [Bordetella pertussis]
MPSGTQSMRVQMPPSYNGERASMATIWAWVGSPMASAPLSSMCRNSTPRLYRVPRMRNCSAGLSPFSLVPQAWSSQSRLDSKPPAASTQLPASMRAPSSRTAATKRSPSRSMAATGVS